MAKQPVLPEEWRATAGLSQGDLARLLGVTGKNPNGTYRRWAIGANKPPLRVVQTVEILSKGVVSTASWIAVRERYLASSSEKTAA